MVFNQGLRNCLKNKTLTLKTHTTTKTRLKTIKFEKLKH